jgi:general secretion pathway protein K
MAASPKPTPPSEAGYALIAAVVSIVLFALMALAAINATRGPTVMVAAEADRARLQAAADAGVSLAIQGLMARATPARWPIDGSTKRVNFANTTLDIRIEDERGKIALNLINREQADRMFREFGLQGSELETATDSFLDWRDGDDNVRPFGAEAEDENYVERKLRPRDGDLRTLGELAHIKGIGPDLARRIAPFSTVNFGTGAFDARYATPLAARVSADNEGDADLAGFDAPIVAGQARSAFRPAVSDSLVGRPLTIIVEARSGQDARARRRAIIELTGVEVRPLVIRARE